MIFDRLFKQDKDSCKATETKPVSTVDYYVEGKAQFEAGNYTQAMEYFQAAIAEHPERENAYLKLADTFLAMGNKKDASSTLYQLLARYPDSTQAQEKLKKCQPIQPPESSIQKNDVPFSIDEEFERINSRILSSHSLSVGNPQIAPQSGPSQQCHSHPNDPFDPHIEFSNYKMPNAGLLPGSDCFRQLLQSDEYQHSTAKLPIVMGLGDDGNPVVEDLSKMPHLMIAGMTNYGGPTFLNGLLLSILFKNHPSDVKLVLMGDKRLLLTSWSQLDKHFLATVEGHEGTPVVDNDKEALSVFKSLGLEMDARFALLRAAKVRKLDAYNELFCQRKLNPQYGHRYLPRIVTVVFELNGILNKETAAEICHLAHLAHTVGIHLILLTNQPLLFTPEIQVNIPTRLAFKVGRLAESNAILGGSGAQNLKQIGEAIYLSPFEEAKHLQCQSIIEEDIDNVVKFISQQGGCPYAFALPEFYFEDEKKPYASKSFDSRSKDEFFDDAARLVVASQFGSTSLLQRKLQLGYNQAGRIIDQLEAAGIVGPYNGSKSRDVLIHDEVELEKMLRSL